MVWCSKLIIPILCYVIEHHHYNLFRVSMSLLCLAMRVVTLFVIPLIMASSVEAIQTLSDDEFATPCPETTGSSSSSGVVLGATLKRKRDTPTKRVPVSHHDTRKILSRIVQSRCECARMSKDKMRRSCFARFQPVLEDLVKLRNKIHTLHKLDSDQFVAYLVFNHVLRLYVVMLF